MSDFIERMKAAVDHVIQARNIFANGPLDFYLETLIEHSEALLTRFSPLKVGQKAVITGHVKCEGGWKGCEDTLKIGAVGTISEVAYSKGRFLFDFIPDVETWRDSEGVYHLSDNPHSYRLSENKLSAVKDA